VRPDQALLRESRRDNFNAIRLALSIGVLFSYSFARRCHVVETKTRSGIAVRNFKRPRRPRATWSSPRPEETPPRLP
jgi:hypothetical protein